MKRIVTIVLAIALLAAAFLQLEACYTMRDAQVYKPGSLDEDWAEHMSGISSQILELAGSPEEWAKVEEGLNFDDYVFRRVETPRGALEVYVAYWTPLKMAPRLVQSHTPDVCWRRVGWALNEARTIRHPNRQDWSVQSRIFTAHAEKRFVWFWHILGGVSFQYGTVGAVPWYGAIADLASYGAKLRASHAFVRISSSEPLDVVLSTVEARSVLRWVDRIACDWPPSSSSSSKIP